MDDDVKALFDVIFQEAHVVDFDLSKWDRRLRLVVSAGLVGDNFDGVGDLHVIDFLSVKSFGWESNHLDASLSDPEQHCQWVIMEFSVEKRDGFDHVVLSGFGPTPEVEILCRDIEIATLDPRIVDAVNPEWNRPYCPLARPGLEELFRASTRP